MSSDKGYSQLVLSLNPLWEAKIITPLSRATNPQGSWELVHRFWKALQNPQSAEIGLNHAHGKKIKKKQTGR